MSKSDEAVANRLMALDFEKDMESFLTKISPKFAALFRPHIERALASPDYKRWLRGEPMMQAVSALVFHSIVDEVDRRNERRPRAKIIGRPLIPDDKLTNLSECFSRGMGPSKAARLAGVHRNTASTYYAVFRSSDDRTAGPLNSAPS